VLSTQVLTRKERRYEPGGMEMVAICERDVKRFRRRPTMTNTGNTVQQKSSQLVPDSWVSEGTLEVSR
jgi:hypothetical protein